MEERVLVTEREVGGFRYVSYHEGTCDAVLATRLDTLRTVSRREANFATSTYPAHRWCRDCYAVRATG